MLQAIPPKACGSDRAGDFATAIRGYVLYWELIKNACERGLKRFHLGRSTTQSGREVFKKKWNAQPISSTGSTSCRTGREIPQLNVTNPKYRLAIRAWQQLPVPVTQVIGPFIARSIPVTAAHLAPAGAPIHAVDLARMDSGDGVAPGTSRCAAPGVERAVWRSAQPAHVDRARRA